MRDFGIILIKPDGMKKNVFIDVNKELKKRGIVIIDIKYFYLSPENIKQYFYYQIDNYIRYMCEGPVLVYYLMGYNCDMAEAIYSLKSSIRTQYCVTNHDMYNLIHGANSGCEFFLQRSLFFPNYSSIDFSSTSDLLVRINNYRCEKKKIINVIRRSNLEYLCIILSSEDFEHRRKIREELIECGVKKIFFGIIKSQIFLGKKVNFIEMYPNDEREKKDVNIINESNNCLLLLDAGIHINYNKLINYREKNFDKYISGHVENIKKYLLPEIAPIKETFRIKGIVTGNARMSIIESESLFLVAKLLNLVDIKGSWDKEFLGRYSTGITDYLKFEKLFLN